MMISSVCESHRFSPNLTSVIPCLVQIDDVKRLSLIHPIITIVAVCLSKDPSIPT